MVLLNSNLPYHGFKYFPIDIDKKLKHKVLANVL